jgi:TPP-dependent pyruvate/acetoin dehydrogenase alpha subunit
MTVQMMAQDAAAIIAMTTYRPAPALASDPFIARLDRTEADIRCDRDQDGLRRVERKLESKSAKHDKEIAFESMGRNAIDNAPCDR